MSDSFDCFPSPVTLIGWTVSSIMRPEPFYRSYLTGRDATRAAMSALRDGGYGMEIRRFWADGLTESMYLIALEPADGVRHRQVRAVEWDVHTTQPFWSVEA